MAERTRIPRAITAAVEAVTPLVKWKPPLPVVILLVALGLLYASKNTLVKLACSVGGKAATGLKVEVDLVDVGVFNTALGLGGLRLYNPPGFAERVLLDLPELYIDYRVLPLLWGTIHLQRVQVHLREIVVVKDAEGRVNVQQITALQPAPAAAKGGPGPAPKPKEKPAARPAKPAFQIDVMDLTVGRVIYKDYSKKEPKVRVFDLNLHERYEQITNPETFAKLVVGRALVETAVDKLTGVDLRGIRGELSQALKKSALELNRAFDDQALTGAADELKRLLNR